MLSLDRLELQEILERHKKWLNNQEGGHRAYLRWADLHGADLRKANLSGATGILSAIDFLENNFEKTEDGYIAYKTFGDFYRKESWTVQEHAIIIENVNFNRTEECGCGINVGTLDWVNTNCKSEIWKVLIRWGWLCGVCVPYASNGKIRCERVELLEIVEEEHEA